MQYDHLQTKSLNPSSCVVMQNQNLVSGVQTCITEMYFIKCSKYHWLDSSSFKMTRAPEAFKDQAAI